MKISKKDIYVIAAANKTKEWSLIFSELERLGHSIYTFSPVDNNNYILMDSLFSSTIIDNIKSADFVLKVGLEIDYITGYQLGVARALKKRLVNIVFEDFQEVPNTDIYEIVQRCERQRISENIIELLDKIEVSSLDIRFNLFIDKRIDLFLKEAAGCSSKSKSEVIRDLIYREMNYKIERADSRFWNIPPKIKVLEALGAVIDGRVLLSIDKRQAMVHASNGKKTYNVSYDNKQNIVVSNDNGSYFAGFIGYPAIAMLMKMGKIQYNENLANIFKGLKWKPINDRFPGNPENAKMYIYTQVLGLSSEEKRDIEKYCDITLNDLRNMKLQKPKIVPKPPTDIDI